MKTRDQGFILVCFTSDACCNLILGKCDEVFIALVSWAGYGKTHTGDFLEGSKMLEE